MKIVYTVLTIVVTCLIGAVLLLVYAGRKNPSLPEIPSEFVALVGAYLLVVLGRIVLIGGILLTILYYALVRPFGMIGKSYIDLPPERKGDVKKKVGDGLNALVDGMIIIQKFWKSVR